MKTRLDVSNINFTKLGGLIPACVQDHETLEVLMIGFMNQEALERTIASGQVTFYSRTKDRLWTKGESSGHFLEVLTLALDCDQDSILISVKRRGPVCHTGSISCFGATSLKPDWYWLAFLSQIITQRQSSKTLGYTNELLNSGLPRVAQKVGEEAVEVVIAALTESGENQEALVGEVVDLFYHVFVLLQMKGIDMQAIALKIQERHESSN